MGKVIKKPEQTREHRPALTPEARENLLISMAMDEAEEQFRNHTASSQVITHFLKLGTAKAQLELEKVRLENELTKAKAESLASAEQRNKLYDKALRAFRSYSGQNDEEDEEYEF